MWQQWFGSAAGMIPDETIIGAYSDLYTVANGRLPSGPLGMNRASELSTGSEDAGERFVNDIDDVRRR